MVINIWQSVLCSSWLDVMLVCSPMPTRARICVCVCFATGCRCRWQIRESKWMFILWILVFGVFCYSQISIGTNAWIQWTSIRILVNIINVSCVRTYKSIGNLYIQLNSTQHTEHETKQNKTMCVAWHTLQRKWAHQIDQYLKVEPLKSWLPILIIRIIAEFRTRKRWHAIKTFDMMEWKTKFGQKQMPQCSYINTERIILSHLTKIEGDKLKSFVSSCVSCFTKKIIDSSD